MERVISIVGIVLIILAFSTGFLYANEVVRIEPEGAGRIIDEIRISGNKRNSDADLFYYIKQGRGQALDLNVVSEDIKRLYRMKLYEDIQVNLEEIDGQNVLIYTLIEKPSIAHISFRGNDEIKTDKLNEKIDLRVAIALDVDKVKDNAEKIREHYVSEGFFLAEVKPVIEKRGDGEVEVIFDIKEYSKAKVRQITIVGNKGLSAESIKSHIFTRESSLKGKLTGAGEYKEEEFQRDIQRIAAWYSDNGYPDGKVRDVQVELSEDRRSMMITFIVEEGEYTTIDEVDVGGDLLGDKETIAKLVSLKGGQGFKLSQLFEDVKAIQDYYGDRGYAYTNVEPKRREGKNPNSVSIFFDIDKGEKVKIGKILIDGNEKTEDKVIRRELLINEGELYHGTKVRESESMVMRTGFFQKVSVTTQASTNPEYIDVKVEVKENMTGSFQIGAGFSSAENFIGTLQISQENFLGRGQFLTAQATISSLRQLFNIQFFEPYFLDSYWRFRASVFNFEYVYTDFTRSSYGGSLGFGYPITRDLVLDLTYKIENVKVKADGSFGRQQRNIGSIFTGGLTSSLDATITWDKRNNRLFPSEGFMLMFSYEQADEYLGSQNEFIRMIGQGRVYFPLFWSWVLKFNLELGIIGNWNAGHKEVPIFERFFVGGPNSIRGFQRSSLGPTRSVSADLSDPLSELSKFNIGGDKELIFNAELEIPIIQTMGISGVVFFDLGNAFNEDQDLSLKWDLFVKEKDYDKVLRSAAGFGFRWLSPMGLLRFEWGFPLAPKEQEEKMIFEFSIGNSF